MANKKKKKNRKGLFDYKQILKTAIKFNKFKSNQNL